jgi:1-aminocyclopropane-1-carboxylate synthase
VSAVQEIAYFHPVSTHTQRFLENLISNRTWCREFIRKNKAKLFESYTLVKELFENQLNIKIIEANAGIFVWADFSDYMEAQTFEAELKLFDKIFNECQVSISPGQFFQSNTPGWFRVCFAQKEEQITTAVERLKKTLI